MNPDENKGEYDMADMTVEQLIDEIEVYIDNCRTTGVLGGGSMIKVNREEILTMLDELHEQLPKEIAESKQVLKTRDTILEDARARADRIIQDAAKEASMLVDNDEIVKIANMRAQSIIEEAEKKAAEIDQNSRSRANAVETGALQYTQSMLDGLEFMYSSIISQEKDYFKAIIDKLEDEHKKVLADKKEVDLQLGTAGSKTARKKEDFEKKGEEKAKKEAGKES